MPKTEAFDKYSDAYDEWFEVNSNFYAMELEAIRRLIPSPQAEGMEVGIGSGKFAVPLGIKIGVEPSKNMADKSIKQGLNVYYGVAEDLPFADNRFDFVLMVTTICFVDDIIKSFQEVHRVLKPNSHIIVGFVDRNSELGKQYCIKKNKSKFYKDATFFSTEEVITCLEKTKFEIIKTNQTLIPGETENVIKKGFGEGAFIAIKAIAV